jgi:predicted phage terminase large subunit-like protein
MIDAGVAGFLAENEREIMLSSCRYTTAAIYGYQIAPPHDSILHHYESAPETLDLAPRGSGKSRIGDIGYITWQALKNPNIRILLVSDTDQHAERFLKTVASGLEYSPAVRRNFGAVKGPRWTSHEIVLAGRTKILSEATVTAIGAYSGAATSGHYDIIVADDLVNFTNSRTEGLREMLIEWFKLTLYPTLVPGGEVHALGTRYHHLELYQVMTDELGFDVQVQRAIETDPETGEEVSLWEEYMPLEDRADPRTGRVTLGLRSLREKLGSVTFSLQYQNDVELLKRGEIFRADWFNWYTLEEDRKGRAYLAVEGEDPIPLKDLAIYAGVDPAFSERDKKRSDYFAIVVIGRHKPTSRFFILDVIRDRPTYEGRADLVAGMWTRWRPRVTAIEDVAGQKEFVQRVKKTLPYIRVKAIKTDKDKTTRAWTRSGLVENGRVFLRRDRSALFVEELCMMPDGPHDDQFDGFDLALEAAGVPRTGMIIQQQKGADRYLDRVPVSTRRRFAGDVPPPYRSKWSDLDH